MFIRRKHANGKTYYSLVESHRDETGKVIQRHIMHLPVIDKAAVQTRPVYQPATDLVRRFYADQNLSSIEDFLEWYKEEFRRAKDMYRFLLTMNRVNVEDHWRFGKSDFLKFERERIKVFKWYRIVKTLRDALRAPTKGRGCESTDAANAKRRKTLEDKQRTHRKLKLHQRGVSIGTILDRGETI